MSRRREAGSALHTGCRSHAHGLVRGRSLSTDGSGIQASREQWGFQKIEKARIARAQLIAVKLTTGRLILRGARCADSVQIRRHIYRSALFSKRQPLFHEMLNFHPLVYRGRPAATPADLIYDVMTQERRAGVSIQRAGELLSKALRVYRSTRYARWRCSRFGICDSDLFMREQGEVRHRLSDLPPRMTRPGRWGSIDGFRPGYRADVNTVDSDRSIAALRC